MAAPTKLEDLFDKKRLQDGLTVVLSIIYFPLGLALVIVRLFMSVHVLLISCLLPRSQFTSFVLKTIYSVIGISVIVEDNEHQNTKAKVLVSNHISSLDHMAIDLVHSNIVPNDIGLPHFLCSIFGYQDFKLTDGIDALKRNVKKFCQESEIPVLLHPERETTNGKVGLLKFHEYPFDLDLPVQPITIQAIRKPFNIPVSVLYSSWFTDFVWCLFVPYTFFKLRYLPIEERQEDETVEQFAERVQEKISASLNLPTTDFTFADKAEYLKKLAVKKTPVQNGRAKIVRPEHLVQQASCSTYTTSDPEIQQMTTQVRDVLPNIPVHIIIQQLEKTRDIDVTIANILEGNVEIPSQDSSNNASSQKTGTHTTSVSIQPAQLKFGASSFGETTKHRQLSLSERKQEMLETARRKYKEKHGLL